MSPWLSKRRAVPLAIIGSIVWQSARTAWRFRGTENRADHNGALHIQGAVLVPRGAATRCLAALLPLDLLLRALFVSDSGTVANCLKGAFIPGTVSPAGGLVPSCLIRFKYDWHSSGLFGLDPDFPFVFKKTDSDLTFCLFTTSWFQDWDFKIQILFWSDPTGARALNYIDWHRA